MKLAIRMLFAPAIVSAYTVYGATHTSHSIAKEAGRASVGVGDRFVGGALGFTYGACYVLTGQDLRTILFKDNK